MSIANENNRVELTASASQASFAYNFKIEADDEIAVYLTPDGNTPDDASDILILTTDYTLTGVGEDAGGTIELTAGSFPSGATADDVVVAIRAIDFDQPDEYSVGEDHAEKLEASVDRMAMRIQRLEEIISRAAVSQVTDGGGYVFPAPDALKLLGWNSAEDAIVNVSPYSEKYYGEYASAPALNPYTGAAPEEGDMYYDTTLNLMMVYNGATWGQINSSVATAANAVNIADAGTFYAATEVESALQELRPESGTWTPAIETSIAAGSGWTESNSGYYERVGKLLYVYFMINITGLSAGAAGDLLITGFPAGHTIKSITPFGLVTNFDANLVNSGTYERFLVDPGSLSLDIINLEESGSGLVLANLDVAAISAAPCIFSGNFVVPLA